MAIPSAALSTLKSIATIRPLIPGLRGRRSLPARTINAPPELPVAARGCVPEPLIGILAVPLGILLLTLVLHLVRGIGTLHGALAKNLLVARDGAD